MRVPLQEVTLRFSVCIIIYIIFQNVSRRPFSIPHVPIYTIRVPTVEGSFLLTINLLDSTPPERFLYPPSRPPPPSNENYLDYIGIPQGTYFLYLSHSDSFFNPSVPSPILIVFFNPSVPSPPDVGQNFVI